MYKSRQSSKGKKISNNITKNIPRKPLQLFTTNNIKNQNNINNFLPFSLIKSRSIIPFSSNTSRNQKNNNLKNSFENLISNQKSLRNSTIKSKSLINTILNQKSKSKPKSKPKRGTSSQKPKLTNLKNTSYLANNEIIKNIVFQRKNNRSKNRNNISKNKNYKTQINNFNHSKTKSNSIRCSLMYVNRYSYISRPEKSKLKYDNCICLTTRENPSNNNNNKFFENNKILNKNKKWVDLFNKFEHLKTKTNSLLNKYHNLTQKYRNELEILNSGKDKIMFVNNKNYDCRKKYLIYDKNDEEQMLNEYSDKKYLNTDVNIK